MRWLHNSRWIGAAFVVSGMIALATSMLAWFHVEEERANGLTDLDRRAHALNHRLLDSVRRAMQGADTHVAATLKDRLEGHRRLIGFAVYRSDGRLIASAKAVTEFPDAMKSPVQRVLEG